MPPKKAIHFTESDSGSSSSSANRTSRRRFDFSSNPPGYGGPVEAELAKLRRRAQLFTDPQEVDARSFYPKIPTFFEKSEYIRAHLDEMDELDKKLREIYRLREEEIWKQEDTSLHPDTQGSQKYGEDRYYDDRSRSEHLSREEIYELFKKNYDTILPWLPKNKRKIAEKRINDLKEKLYRESTFPKSEFDDNHEYDTVYAKEHSQVKFLNDSTNLIDAAEKVVQRFSDDCKEKKIRGNMVLNEAKLKHNDIERILNYVQSLSEGLIRSTRETLQRPVVTLKSLQDCSTYLGYYKRLLEIHDKLYQAYHDLKSRQGEKVRFKRLLAQFEENQSKIANHDAGSEGSSSTDDPLRKLAQGTMDKLREQSSSSSFIEDDVTEKFEESRKGLPMLPEDKESRTKEWVKSQLMISGNKYTEEMEKRLIELNKDLNREEQGKQKEGDVERQPEYADVTEGRSSGYSSDFDITISRNKEELLFELDQMTLDRE